MSSSIDVYIGAFLKLKLKKVTIKNSYRICNNHQCILYNEKFVDGEKFCPKCGDPIRDKKIPEDTLLSYYDWLSESANDKFVDELIRADIDDDGHNILISNYTVDNYAHDIEDGGYIDITVIDTAKKIKKFAQKNEKLIKTLEKTFGANNISLHWGTVVYYL